MPTQSIKPLPAAAAPQSSGGVSAAEWQARTGLAACYRLLAHLGISDLTYNHLSVRVPGEPDRLLIKSPTMMFEEITASNLLKFDLDGEPLQEGPRLRGGGLVIHAGILRARPDLNAVFHTHSPANIGVSAQQQGLMMISQHAVYFYGRLAYHDFGGFEFNMDQREPLVRSLGRERVAILRNHGVLVCGRTLPEAFIDHHLMEMACKGQIAALAGGAKVNVLSETICRDAAAQQQDRMDDPEKAAAKDWDACLRLAKRLFPDYQN